MSRTAIHTPHAIKPLAPYSQAIRANGFVHTASILGLDPSTGQLAGDDIRAQTERCMLSLTAILEAAGTDMAHVVRANVYLLSLDDYAGMNEVYARYMPADPPARMTNQMGAMPFGAKVSIDMIAVMPDREVTP